MSRLAMSPFAMPAEASIEFAFPKSRGKSIAAGLSAALLLFLLAPSLAHAQIDAGSITGTVRDHSGAVVSGAKVTVTNEATNVSATTTSNSNGEYVATSLKVGTYSVSVEQAGFQKSVHTGIILNVQDRKQVDATLEVGAVTQAINVAGDVPLLQTESAGVGQVVTSQTIVDLPLNGRLYDQLALLVPGVTVDTPRQQGRGEGVFDVNGNWGTQNNFILDGVDNNSFSESLQEGSAQVVVPAVDSLSEFRLQTRTYDAEFGRNAGSVVNATTKSGTNQIHGDVYEFLRNSDLDATNYFLNEAGQPKPEFRQNQFGFTLGGPVYIPKLYHGRNKTFWFGNYEGTRIAQGTTLIGTVPTPLMREGNFTELPQSISSPTASGLGGFGGCIQNKVVQASCMDPVAQKLLSLYPMPNFNTSQLGVPGSFTGNNYINSPTYTTSRDAGAIKVDHTISPSDNIFGRFTTNDTTLRDPGILYSFNPIADGGQQAVTGKTRNRGTNAAFGWTHVFSPSLLNDFRAGYNRVASHDEPLEFGQNVSSQFGTFGIPFNPVYSGGLPSLSISGFTGLGAPTSNPQDQYSGVWQYRDGLTWIHGNHTMKFGGEWRRDSEIFLDLNYNRGYFQFTGQYSGSAFSDFLLGLPTQTGLETVTIPHLYQNGLAFFAQDTWKITQKLTVNYGVRYEYVSPQFDRSNQITNFIPTLDGGLGGLQTVAPDASGTYNRTLVQPWRLGFVPRLGLAYQITPKLVFRAGGGYFMQGYDRHGGESMPSLNPPFLVDQDETYTANSAPAILLKNGFPPNYIVPVSIADQSQIASLFIKAEAGNLRPAMVGQISANFQYSVAKNTMLEVGYVGNNAHHLWQFLNYNQGIISTPGVAPILPYPQFGTPGAPSTIEWLQSSGNSNYNALQIKFERRFSNGLAFLFSYAWSKGISDVVEGLATDGQPDAYGRWPVPQDAHNLKSEKALFLGDTPQRLVSTVLYQIPLGKGHKFASSGVADLILGGWQANVISTYASGQPIGIYDAVDLSGTTFQIERPNCVGNVPFSKNINEWLNAADYSTPTAYTFGNCSITPGGRVPGIKNWDASLLKNFFVSEHDYFQFRTEFFNLFNTTQFEGPDSVFGTPSFGKISTIQVNPRQIQFAMKFYF